MTLRIHVLLCFLFFILTTQRALSANYYVNDLSTTGDVFCTAVGNAGNNGQTANTPKLSVGAILTTYSGVLTSGDTIFIDAGTYTSEVALTVPPALAGLTFMGAGYNQTIFDNGFAGSNTNFFMYINASNTQLLNMSFTGYTNNGTQTPGHSGQAITIGGGGAISNVLLQNINFYNNGTGGGNPALVVLANSDVTLVGGGSYCNAPGSTYSGGVEAYGNNINLTIRNYILANNDKTLFNGGGLRIEGGNNTFVNVINSRISNNRGNEGGAIAQFNGTLTMRDCILDGNSTVNSGTHYGAAFKISAGNASFSNCVFSNNTGGGTGCRGGAIGARYTGTTGAFSSNAIINVVVDSCVFSNNSPGTRGRDIYGANGSGNTCTITATDCQFLTGGNFNVFSDGASPASSISVSYFGTAPTQSGSNVSVTASANTLFTPVPAPPNYSGSCGSIVILPVELVEFQGACSGSEQIHFNWTTASETNNAAFIIEELDDWHQWQEVARVNSRGNTHAIQHYEYQLNHRKSVYYRLKQLDLDGVEHVLKAIHVANSCSDENGLLSAYLANQSLAIAYNFPRNTSVELQLVNTLGQTILQQEVSFDKDYNLVHLSLNQPLSPGVYYLRGAQEYLIKVVVR